jgi:hypothetical protein
MNPELWALAGRLMAAAVKTSAQRRIGRREGNGEEVFMIR